MFSHTASGVLRMAGCVFTHGWWCFYAWLVVFLHMASGVLYTWLVVFLCMAIVVFLHVVFLCMGSGVLHVGSGVFFSWLVVFYAWVMVFLHTGSVVFTHG